MFNPAWLILSAIAFQPTPGKSEMRAVPKVGGREYLLHLPKGYDSQSKYPLVLAFHGLSESAKTMEEDSGLSDKADSAKFIIAYPQGLNQSWNAGECCRGNRTDDVAFVTEVLADIARLAEVDTDRIYAVGMSNGAMMANRLACEKSDIFAAIGTVAGLRVISPCTPSRPMPLIHIHGSKDGMVAMNGKGLLPGQTVAAHVAYWVKHNHSLSSTPEDLMIPLPFKASKELYPADPSVKSADVVFILIEGGGHLWPGRPFPTRLRDPEVINALGQTTMDFRANDEIWDFFVNHPMK